MFIRLKKLALNNLSTSILWLIFIELDLLFIGKFLGSKELQIYSPLVTIFGLMKYLTSMVFSPISIRIFHCNGGLSTIKKDIDKYGSLVFSLILFASVSLSSNGTGFIISWVGQDFKLTAQAMGIVSLYYALSPFSYVYSSYLVAKEKVKILYKMSVFQTFGFWLIIFLTYHFAPKYFNLQTFVYIKLLMFLSIDLYSLCNLRKLKLFTFSPFYIIKLFIASGSIVLMSFYIKKYIVITQSFMNFTVLCCYLASLTIIISMIFNHRLIKNWINKLS